MPLPASEQGSASLAARLEEAMQRLDDRLTSCRDWMAHSELLFEDWSTRWQQSAVDIAERLELIERHVGPTEQPALRVYGAVGTDGRPGMGKAPA